MLKLEEMKMEKLKLDDFTKYTFLSGLEYNPRGSHACFAVHKADMEENSYKSNLWLYDVQKDKSWQLTAFDKEKGFIWQDDEHILFPGMRNPRDKEKAEGGGEFTIYYRININGGEAQEAFRIPLAVESITNIDSTRFLLTATFNSNRPDLEGMSEKDKGKELEKRKEDKDYEVLDEIPFWRNGGGFTNRDRSRLCLYDSSTGKYEVLTDDTMDAGGVRLNDNKDKAVFIGQPCIKGKWQMEDYLFILDIEAKSVRQLTKNKFSWSGVFFIGNTLVAMGSDMKEYGINQDVVFYRVDQVTGEQQLLAPEFNLSTWNSVGSDCRLGGGNPFRVDDGYLYFIATEGSSSYIYRIDLEGRFEKVSTAEGSVDSYDVRESKTLFVGLRGHQLQELYRLEAGKEEKLTGFNDWIIDEKHLAPLEQITVETAPGVTIQGWVMKPVDYEEGKKYPAILDIHGGPKTVYGEVFFHEMQYWANAGYFVFFCNPRGSDGRGNEFADIRGKYGTIDYDDLMAFTDAVLAKFQGIDQERVGVTGGSYGGFMTNWIIGHTDRFKAAASQRSISNWVSMGFTSDIGFYFEEDQVTATPWSDIDKVWWHSPLKYADQVSTPTLFIHSEEDYRCWLPEGLQMFTALKYFGVDSRLCMFRGESHELSRSGKPKHRIRRLKEITDWFDKYLK
jgi:dipeptidyl aminopeptidase/acylaminoacyl peptidase